LSIQGHADRYDLPATPEERRAIELGNSEARAVSALQWAFDRMCDRLLDAGATQPADWADAQNVRGSIVRCGAADLRNLTPGNDEALRRENRRVVFVITTFNPA
jgi:hypothetical protein